MNLENFNHKKQLKMPRSLKKRQQSKNIDHKLSFNIFSNYERSFRVHNSLATNFSIHFKKYFGNRDEQ